MTFLPLINHTFVAFAIVKDMNFHSRVDKQFTPQKIKNLNGSSIVKRIRLTSSSSTKSLSTSKIVQTLTLNSNIAKSTSLMLDDKILFIFYFDTYEKHDDTLLNTVIVKIKFNRSSSRSNTK